MTAREVLLISLATFAALASPATESRATVIPPNLPPGSQYQLVFVTAGKHDALSSNIADYNAFVVAEAAMNPSLPSSSWHAIGSTAVIDAFDNAPWTPGIPVYNVLGEEVAAGDVGLYAGSLVNPVRYDQYGNSSLAEVWTGSAQNGRNAGSPLGADMIIFGLPYFTNNRWLAEARTYPYFTPATHTTVIYSSIYALSEPITVPAPEPTSVVLAALGVAGLIGYRLRQRKCRLPGGGTRSRRNYDRCY